MLPVRLPLPAGLVERRADRLHRGRDQPGHCRRCVGRLPAHDQSCADQVGTVRRGRSAAPSDGFGADVRPGRPGPSHAVDVRSDRDRRFGAGGRTAYRRVRQQVGAGDGVDRRGGLARAGGGVGQLCACPVLHRPRRRGRLVPRTARRRGANARTGVDGGGDLGPRRGLGVLRHRCDVDSRTRRPRRREEH